MTLTTDAPSVGAPRPPFTLSGSTPNPFVGQTSIRFSLPAAGEHSLVVYDVAGRRVVSLSSGWADAGSHLVRWNGRNQKGTLMPSGVYFYRLSSRHGELSGQTVLRR